MHQNPAGLSIRKTSTQWLLVASIFGAAATVVVTFGMLAYAVVRQINLPDYGTEWDAYGNRIILGSAFSWSGLWRSIAWIVPFFLVGFIQLWACGCVIRLRSRNWPRVHDQLTQVRYRKWLILWGIMAQLTNAATMLPSLLLIALVLMYGGSTFLDGISRFGFELSPIVIWFCIICSVILNARLFIAPAQFQQWRSKQQTPDPTLQPLQTEHPEPAS
jgi:hypothetical protein